MRFFQKEHIFLNDWAAITSAFWVKYPNELQPHVLRVDTLDIEVDVEKEQFVCRRLLSLKYQCPRWVQRFFGASPIGFAVEEATCSLKERKLTIRACNYTFSTFFRVEEQCEYSEHPDNSQHTLYKQTATYRVWGLGVPVNRAVENAAVAQAAEKSTLGVSAVERIVSFLEEKQWRNRCNSCLLSLEEAAAHASKHAQQKYRELRDRVNRKFGCSGQSDHVEDYDAKTCDGDESGEPVLPMSIEPSLQHGGTKPLTLSGNTKRFTSLFFTPGEIGTGYSSSIGDRFQKYDDTRGLRRSNQGSSSDPFIAEEANIVEAGCPCRAYTPAGTKPKATAEWRDLRKRWRDVSTLEACTATAVSAQQPPPIPSSSHVTAVDLQFGVREVASAAHCQEEQQRTGIQSIDWRAQDSRTLKQWGGIAISSCYNRNSSQHRDTNIFGFGLLFSSFGPPASGG